MFSPNLGPHSTTAPNSTRPASVAERPRLTAVLEYIRDCPDRYFVTLTTKRSLDPLQLSYAVHDLSHRVNAKLFGPAYRRRKTHFLAQYTVQERTYDQGLHAHMLVGIPEGALSVKANPSCCPPHELIIQLWCGMGHGGRPQAQNIQQISDFSGVAKYIHKDIWTLDRFDNLDLANTNIPALPPTVPQQAG